MHTDLVGQYKYHRTISEGLKRGLRKYPWQFSGAWFLCLNLMCPEMLDLS